MYTDLLNFSMPMPVIATIRHSLGQGASERQHELAISTRLIK